MFISKYCLCFPMKFGDTPLMPDEKRPSAAPKHRGCVIAIVAVVAVMVLLVVVAGVVAWRYSATEEGQRLLDAGTAWYRATASDEAHSISDSLRCQALLFPIEDAQIIDPKVARFVASLPSSPAHVVACAERRGHPLALSCGELGQAWRDATGLNEPVIAWVAMRNGNQCLEVSAP